jgi:hypothetical protein
MSKQPARGYFAQLADPAPSGEPVFTARRGESPRLGLETFEPPVIEDVIQASGGSTPRVASSVRRKPLGIHPLSIKPLGIQPRAVPGASADAASSIMAPPARNSTGGDTGTTTAARTGSRPMPPYRPLHARDDNATGSAQVLSATRRVVESNRETPRASVNLPRVESSQPRTAEPGRQAKETATSSAAQHDAVRPVLSAGETKPAPTAPFAMPAQTETSHSGVLSRREPRQSDPRQQPAPPEMLRVESDAAAAPSRKPFAEEVAGNRQIMPREFAGDNSGRETGASVRIGTVEVRISSPQPIMPATPQVLPEAQSKRAESHPGSRPLSRDPLASGLAWNYGLIQG